jgi:hypothetical protein
LDIFSKREGPRPEDVRAKRLISENAGTIRKLADQFSNGGFTKMRQDQARRREEPKPEGLLIYPMSAPATPDDPEPYVRVSLNGRVVLTDVYSGRQIQLLGEIRSKVGSKRFVLATEENGFISPVNEEIRAALAPYENVELTAQFTENDIVQRFEECLGLAGKRHMNLTGSDAETEKGHGATEDDSSELL